jgi:uncharacterized membrane protein YbaN (DUF454 family)
MFCLTYKSKRSYPHIPEREFFLDTSAELQAYLEQKGKSIRKANMMIAILAILSGVSYFAFQESVTELLLLLLIIGSIPALMVSMRKDTDMFKLNVDEAQELYTEWFGPDSRSDQTTEANTEA